MTQVYHVSFARRTLFAWYTCTILKRVIRLQCFNTKAPQRGQRTGKNVLHSLVHGSHVPVVQRVAATSLPLPSKPDFTRLPLLPKWPCSHNYWNDSFRVWWWIPRKHGVFFSHRDLLLVGGRARALCSPVLKSFRNPAQCNSITVLS